MMMRYKIGLLLTSIGFEAHAGGLLGGLQQDLADERALSTVLRSSLALETAARTDLYGKLQTVQTVLSDAAISGSPRTGTLRFIAERDAVLAAAAVVSATGSPVGRLGGFATEVPTPSGSPARRSSTSATDSSGLRITPASSGLRLTASAAASTSSFEEAELAAQAALSVAQGERNAAQAAAAPAEADRIALNTTLGEVSSILGGGTSSGGVTLTSAPVTPRTLARGVVTARDDAQTRAEVAVRGREAALNALREAMDAATAATDTAESSPQRHITYDTSRSGSVNGVDLSIPPFNLELASDAAAESQEEDIEALQAQGQIAPLEAELADVKAALVAAQQVQARDTAALTAAHNLIATVQDEKATAEAALREFIDRLAEVKSTLGGRDSPALSADSLLTLAQRAVDERNRLTEELAAAKAEAPSLAVQAVADKEAELSQAHAAALEAPKDEAKARLA
jgi:hypothetical protein